MSDRSNIAAAKTRKHWRTGKFEDARFRKLNSPPPGEPWVWITQEMLSCAAWRALSRAGLLVVFRLIAEHMGHGGTRNGDLKVTFKDFETYGVRRSSIGPAIAEAEELGFIERTRRGSPLRPDHAGEASTYRLTWLPTPFGDPPTYEYRQFGDDLDLAREAARTVKEGRQATRPHRTAPVAAPEKKIATA